MAQVTLSVLMPACPDGVTVLVTGSCAELGSWSPQSAKPMTLVSVTDCGEMWSTTVEVSVGCFEYRYFTACILQSFSGSSAGSCGCIVAVQNWESGKKPRIMESTAAAVNSIDVYGAYDDVKSVSRGWLTGQSEIHLRMHSEVMWLKDRVSSQDEYHIRCEPVDMRPVSNSGTLSSRHCLSLIHI